MKLTEFLMASILVGLISFGGGKAFIPVYEKVYVKDYEMITHEQLQEYVGYSIALPGPISPMLTGLVGFEKFGILGFFIGILALSIPPLFIIFMANHFLQRWQDSPKFKFINIYLQPVILALLFYVVIEFINPYMNPIFNPQIHLLTSFSYLVCFSSFVGYFVLKQNHKIYKRILGLLGLAILVYIAFPIILTASLQRNILIFFLSTGLALIGLMKFKIHPFILILIYAIIGGFFIYL